LKKTYSTDFTLFLLIIELRVASFDLSLLPTLTGKSDLSSSFNQTDFDVDF